MSTQAAPIDSEQRILQDLLNDLESSRLTLPTLPEVALKIRDEIDKENVTAAAIAKVISSDAALSAKLLQVANSPLYRAKNPIENIKAAIARLGYMQVKNLVNSLVMKQMFQATSDLLDQKLRDCWNHSAQVAAIASVIAAQTPGLEKDQAMLIGLVHDIGKLPILVHAEEMPELLDNEELLNSLLARLHTTIGEKILTSWQLPESLVRAASEHENLHYRHEGAPDYTDVAIVANLQSLCGQDHPLGRVDWSTIPAFEKLGIATDIEFVEIEENKAQVEEIENILITS